jgi:hypothetical protein
MPNRRQEHGFAIEDAIRQKVFLLPKENNSTSIHDIEHTKNKFNSNENISIKATTTNNIGCGDIDRFTSYDFTKNNTIIICKYNIKNLCINIFEIIEISYTKEMHQYLFGSCPKDILSNYVKSIHDLPHGLIPKKDRTYLTEKKEIQKKYNMNCIINPKVDSKTQRRVQCSFNLNKLLIKFPNLIISKNTGSILRGIKFL